MENYIEFIEILNDITKPPHDRKIKVRPGTTIGISSPRLQMHLPRFTRLLMDFPNLVDGLTAELMAPIVLTIDNAYKMIAVGNAAGFWNIYPNEMLWPAYRVAVPTSIGDIRIVSLADDRLCLRCYAVLPPGTPEYAQRLCAVCQKDINAPTKLRKAPPKPMGSAIEITEEGPNNPQNTPNLPPDESVGAFLGGNRDNIATNYSEPPPGFLKFMPK